MDNEEQKNNIETRDENQFALSMPVVALDGICIFPYATAQVSVIRPEEIKAVEEAMNGDQSIFLVAVKKANVKNRKASDLYSIGTIACVKQFNKADGGMIVMLAEGRTRGRLLEIDTSETAYMRAMIAPMDSEDRSVKRIECEAMLREIKEQHHAFALLEGDKHTGIHKKVDKLLEDLKMPLSVVLDTIASSLASDIKRKQPILETISLRKRFELVSALLSDEAAISEVRKNIVKETKAGMEERQREFWLREQLHVIQSQLGEDDEVTDVYKKRLSELDAADYVKEKIAKEIQRLQNYAPGNQEGAVIQDYIETLLDMPWNKGTEDLSDLAFAKQVLEEDHYGLTKVKDRILEYLAVRKLTGAENNQILCLVGPPGTGKTSIARSVARALGKEYVRISLGGVKDESEIRGHRRTYVAAMPGRIAEGIRKAGVNNPLMLLDEIDKTGSSHKGDTAAALLEVLDSDQNSTFADHYIEIPLDLSKVLFLATANDLSEIPTPLRDRMDIIEISGYTGNEKFHIARDYLVAKALKATGLTESRVTVTDEALKTLIGGYTREAGVRNLERRLTEVFRKVARATVEKEENDTAPTEEAAVKKKGKKKSAGKVKITAKSIEKYLGKAKYTSNHERLTDQIGIVRGLAWTRVGGDTMEIEVALMPGKGELKLTGQLGDVMKESAMTGLSYVRSVAEHFGIDAKVFSEKDIHIHVPEGAVPKDGPSAGITMATALISAFTETCVKGDVAMTGEITLRGRVLPIGGLKEKLLAAGQAGMKTVIVPDRNRKDVEEISEEITGGLNIVYAKNMETVLKTALTERIKK